MPSLLGFLKVNLLYNLGTVSERSKQQHVLLMVIFHLRWKVRITLLLSIKYKRTPDSTDWLFSVSKNYYFDRSFLIENLWRGFRYEPKGYRNPMVGEEMLSLFFGKWLYLYPSRRKYIVHFYYKVITWSIILIQHVHIQSNFKIEKVYMLLLTICFYYS